MPNFHVYGKGLFCNSVKYNNMLYAIKTLKNLNSMLQPTNTAFLCSTCTLNQKKIFTKTILKLSLNSHVYWDTLYQII